MYAVVRHVSEEGHLVSIGTLSGTAGKNMSILSRRWRRKRVQLPLRWHNLSLVHGAPQS